MLEAALALLVIGSVTAAVALLARRRRRAREALRAAFLEAVAEGDDPKFVSRTRRSVVLGWKDGAEREIPWTLPQRAVAGAGNRDRSTVFRSLLALLRARPLPLEGPFGLKTHGPRLLPRLAAPELLLFTSAGSAPAHTPLADTGLWVIYVVEGHHPPRYILEEHLDQAGVDARAIHGVALAVLGQRFEEERLLEAARGGRELRLQTADGCGASRLLLLPELLRDGRRLAAAVPDPQSLWLAAPERAAELPARAEPGKETLLELPLLVTASGPRML